MSDFDVDWAQFPVSECYELDALCDRFELALTQDPATRIEPFIADLPQPQQRLIVRELVQLEIEQRRATGEFPIPDEYASRFPQWAEEIQALATETIEDLDRSGIASSDTIDQSFGADNDTQTSEIDLHTLWRDQWRASSEAVRHADLPTDGVLGHYRLRSVIGRGGMGLVVRAHDTKLTRDVAIKILATSLSHDDTAHERFLREARAAAVIRHAHVVTIYAVEEVDRLPFLVMELIEGTTLEEYLRTKGKLPASEIVEICCQMAQGLAAAHRQSLIHRDVKPANILLENVDRPDHSVRLPSQWHVKITDFGLARVAAEVQLTHSGLIAGTPQYMSPEQANGQELDTRSDLFSLGSVMYAMCAGQAAFQAGSALAIVRQVADKPARPLREVSPETPGWLIDIIEKLMAKSPDDRIQSADELAALLARHVRDLQIGIVPSDVTAFPVVVKKGLPRRPALFVVLGTSLIAAIIGMLVTDRNGPKGVDMLISTDAPDNDVVALDVAADVLPRLHAWPVDAPAPAIAPFDTEQAKTHQDVWAKYLHVPVEYTNSIGMKLRLIPPGEFMMGSSPIESEEALPDAYNEAWVGSVKSESPQRKVILTQPFFLGIYEVTQRQYQQLVGTNPSYYAESGEFASAVAGLSTGDFPVDTVNWLEAGEFCNELSRREGLTSSYLSLVNRPTFVAGNGYVLPTEAQWEFACRAGTTTRFWSGNKDEDLLQVGWHKRNQIGRSHQVGELRANPFGLHDVHGNLWEWVQDALSSAEDVHLEGNQLIDPILLGRADDERILRGGQYYDPASLCRAAMRPVHPIALHSNITGFRVSLSVDAVQRAVRSTSSDGLPQGK